MRLFEAKGQPKVFVNPTQYWPEGLGLMFDRHMLIDHGREYNHLARKLLKMTTVQDGRRKYDL